MEQQNTSTDLVKEVFNRWNAMKRYRTLASDKRKVGRMDEANQFELDMYKESDSFELALRGLQRQIHRDAVVLERGTKE